MAFRADEEAAKGFERARTYFVSRDFSQPDRERAESVLRKLVDELGPVVEGYPSWHPLVAHAKRYSATYPSEKTGYIGLDHTRLFAHGFVTCPYQGADNVIGSVGRIQFRPGVDISAERLDVPFYAAGTEPVLVRCDWNGALEPGHTVPKSHAVPLMLERELPNWRSAQCAETWDTMRSDLLGSPHGSRSSLFVSQDTALALKKAYLTLVDSGMFGALN